MEVIRVGLLVWVGYLLMKGSNKWQLVAALAVASWFPVIGNLIDQGMSTIIELLHTSVGAIH